MSKGFPAQTYNYGAGRPMVQELTYTGTTSNIRELASKIDENISKGCAVLVRGWTPTPALGFNIEDIGLYRPTLDQEVIVQGSYLHRLWEYVFGTLVDGYIRVRCQRNGPGADLSEVHNKTSMRNFIALAADEGSCLNLLDLPNAQPDVPIFLR